ATAVCGKNWRQLWSVGRNVEKAGWCSFWVTKRSGSPALSRGDPEASAAARRSAEEEWLERSGVTRRGVDHRLRHGAVAHGRTRLALGRSGRPQFLPPALGRGLDHAARAPDRRKGAAVEIVNVAPGLQLAGVVDEGGLIGEVDPDRRRLQLQVLLG